MVASKEKSKAASPPIGKERHRHLLDDPKVKAWYDGRALRSRLSADVYLRQLGSMAERLKLSPQQIASLGTTSPDELEARLLRYATDLKSEGRLDSYVAKTFDGLRSWLRSRRVSFDAFPKLSPIRGVSLEAERVPTPEELRRVLDRMTPRGRVIALLMAHSGLRPGVLGSYRAADGLTLGDIQDLKLGKRTEWVNVPFEVRVPARLSKTRKAYTTFGSQELASALGAYLDERASRGERLGPRSPVVVASTRGAAQSWATSAAGFLTTKAVVKEIRTAMAGSTPDGVVWRPYVCRAYCSTRLLMAEGSGKITRDLREAILGHDGGVSARYNVGKRWGDELLKEARAAYRRCEPFLSTSVTAVSPDRDLTTRKVVLRMHGYSEEELARIDISTKTDDELIALADAKRLENQRASRGSSPSPGQRVAKLAEVERLLGHGWEFVAPLGPDRVVLRSSGVLPQP
jgi:integrase